MANNDDWLLAHLGQFGENPALIWQDRTFSYQELLSRVQQWCEELSRRGVEPGQCVALQGGFSPGTCALLLALMAQRMIAVPLSTAAAAERDTSLAVARASWLYTFDRQDDWKVESLAQNPADDHPMLVEFRRLGEPGLILLSSGSPGQMKASLHSFPRILEGFRGRAAKPFRSLAFLSLDHVGGINTLLHILTSGGVVITLPERTAEAICAGIQRHRVQLLPATPTFLRMLLISETYKKYDLSSLELITYGTEPMPAATLEALHAALPNVRLKQTYGLTETGVLPTKSEGDGSLWLAVGGKGFETKVVDGVLWIRSPAAMIGYLNAPNPFDADGWLNTGDLVEQRGEYIRFLGRKSEIINIGGEKVFPAEVENVIQQLDNIKEVTVRGRSNPITGNIVVATVELIEPEDPDALEARVRAACRGRLAAYKIPAMVELADGSLCGGRFKKIRKAAAKKT